MNPFFNWLKDSGTQAMLVLLGTFCAFAAAFAAIWYGRKSLTKRDLKRVEDNTAHLEEVRSNIASVDSRLKKQEVNEALRRVASRVPITASGNQAGNAPYPVQLVIRESREGKVSLTHIELYNERDNPFGSFPCESVGNPNGVQFQAKIPVDVMGNWFRGGTAVQTSNRMRLKLRVWMLINGTEAYKEMAVQIFLTQGAGPAGYALEGNA